MKQRLRYSLVAVFVLTTLIAAGLWMARGNVIEIELSVLDFSQRRSGYQTLFGYRLPHSSYCGQRNSTMLSQYLTEREYFLTEQAVDSFVAAKSVYPGGEPAEGPAYHLWFYLYRIRDREGMYWIHWTEMHPTIAGDFWHVALSLSRIGAYEEVSLLLANALDVDTPDDVLRHRIDETASKYGVSLLAVPVVRPENSIR